MLRLAFGFFVLSFITALIGFGWPTSASFELARVLFFGFLGMFALTFGIGLVGRGSRRRTA